MNEFLELVKNGIPISTPLNIFYNDIIELSNDKKNTKRIISKEYEKYINYLKEKTIECDIDFFQSLCILSNPITLEKEIHFSPDAFISSILYFLNVDNICNEKISIDQDTDKLYSKMIIQTEKLENIISEKTLKRQFPKLYYKYTIYYNFYEKVKKINKFLNNKNIPIIDKLNFYAETSKDAEKYGKIDWEEENKKACEFNVSNFCKLYAKAFRLLIEKMEDIIDYLYDTPIRLNKLNIDKDKLDLYITSNAMDMCEKGDSKIQQSFINFVYNYFNKDINRKHSDKPEIMTNIEYNEGIKSFSKGKLVTPRTLYERYRQFMKNHPNIKLIDFSRINLEGMNLEEVEKFLYYYLRDLQANWEIIPDVEYEIENNINSLRTRQKTEDEKKYHDEVLSDLLIEKMEIYGKTNPFFRIKGKNTFNGYIGFIYPNGKVILDKFFDNEKNKKIAEYKAIYIMNIEDFYRLSQFPRRILMRDPKVKRYYHNGSWQDRIINEANSGPDKIGKTENELKSLIKKNKITI